MGAPRYRIGDLTIDVGRQRVMRGESVIALPKLSYELLMALVRAAPNLASFDTLMDQVWPKAVVSPETLGQRVKLLRDALGDDPRAPRYVEGLRGRGYRLIPTVECVPAGDVTAAAAPEDGPVASESTSPKSVGPTEAPVPAVEVSVSPVEASVVAQRSPIAVVEAAARSATQSLGLRRPPLLWGSVVTALVLLGGVFLVRHLIHLQPPKTQTRIEVVAVQPRAVAVLPFDNLSSERDNDYIALGVADSVLHRLASVPELIVVARSSSFALGKPTPEAREAGRKLGVRYLVSGSVQRAGKTLRVTAQLTDTTSNVALWSLKLDRTIDDVFALQDQIAQQVADELDVTLRGRSAAYARFGTDAYLAFLRGRALIESRRMSDVEESMRQFSRAIELAPTFAAAIAELARAKEQLASLHSDPNAHSTTIQPELNALIERAIQIDSTIGEPYFLRAEFKYQGGNPGGAEADYRRGLELAPNFGPGLRSYAYYLYDQQRVDEALVQLDRARLVEPLSAENHYVKGEMMRTALLRYEEAGELYLQALSVQPEFYPAYTRLATVRWELGRLAEAIRYGEKAVAIEPTIGWTRERLVWFYVDAGDLPAARDVLRGYPSGAIEQRAPEALVCYRAGKLDSAASILQKNIVDPDFNSGGFAFLMTLNAVIERAITSHDAGTARRLFMAMPDIKKEGDVLAIVRGNFPVVVQLATLEHAVGDRAVANDMAQRILQFLDGSPEVHLIAGWDEWARASASTILGRNDAALAHLETLVQSDFRIGWWSRIERDPGFTVLRETPRFKAIVAASRVWLENQKQLVEQMRQSGEIPRRSGDQLTPSGC
jgi:TolB-like protein/DNA-binding winged helix-turn-helix (wHTH) protein